MKKRLFPLILSVFGCFAASKCYWVSKVLTTIWFHEHFAESSIKSRHCLEVGGWSINKHPNYIDWFCMCILCIDSQIYRWWLVCWLLDSSSLIQFLAHFTTLLFLSYTDTVSLKPRVSGMFCWTPLTKPVKIISHKWPYIVLLLHVKLQAYSNLIAGKMPFKHGFYGYYINDGVPLLEQLMPWHRIKACKQFEGFRHDNIYLLTYPKSGKIINYAHCSFVYCHVTHCTYPHLVCFILCVCMW